MAKYLLKPKVLLILCSIPVGLVSYYFIALAAYHIPSGAMEPTLEVGDRLLVDKSAYDFENTAATDTPKRGDVIVFRVPHKNDTAFIKRVIGLPGDTVQMKGGRLFINRKLIKRQLFQYINYTNYRGREVRAKEYDESLPGGALHRIYEQTDDGQYDNTRAFKVPEGHYFVMGNNRDASLDSRARGHSPMGYIDKNWIIGRAFTTTYSLYDRTQGKDIECSGGVPFGRFFTKIQ